MSYQVLYIIPRAEAPATAGAAGTCVCTEDTPAPLLQELKETTRVRRTAWGSPSFLYRTLEAGEKIYHVMTCLRPCPDGTLAHHLVFTEAETAVLRREEVRPTPAGIMFALCREQFWPLSTLPDSPPKLTIEAESLPDPTVQPTWKRLTGHKSTAKKLNESPFDARCALLMPRESDSLAVLRLLHESDWLTSLCGWGVSFCTAADAADVNTSLRRFACAEGSAAALAAQRAGLPSFPVRQEKERLTPTRAYRPEYVYAEEEDALFYPVARKLSRTARQRLWWTAAAALPVAAVLLFIGRNYLPHPVPPAAPTAEPPAAPQQEPPAPTAAEEPQQPAEQPASVAPAVLLPGSELPDALVQAAAQGTLQLTDGELRVGLFGAEGCIIRTLTAEHPATLIPDAAGYSLRYDEETAPLHLRLILENGRLQDVTLNGSPAAADFTLPDKGQRLILIPLMQDVDGGTARFAKLPATWPPGRYLACDKQLTLTPPSAAYPYGKLQIGRGIPALPAEGGGSARINFPLGLPDLGTDNRIPDPQNELPADYGYRWRLRTGKATLTVVRDIAAAVHLSFEHRMNAYCGGTAAEGDSYFSLATLYGLATLLENSKTLPPAERDKALQDYARLFTDAAFRRLVEEEILPPADHALCRSAEGAADDSPRGEQQRQELAALLTPANCFKIREAVAQQVQPTLRSGYEAAVKSLPPAPHPVLQLRRVTLQEDGSLEWQFRLYPATEP